MELTAAQAKQAAAQLKAAAEMLDIRAGLGETTCEEDLLSIRALAGVRSLPAGRDCSGFDDLEGFGDENLTADIAFIDAPDDEDGRWHIGLVDEQGETMELAVPDGYSVRDCLARAGMAALGFTRDEEEPDEDWDGDDGELFD